MNIKLSEFTKKIFNNINEFNGGVVVNKTVNNVTSIHTKSKTAGLFLQVDIPETFEHDFVVSDLGRFMNIYDSIDGAEIELHKSYAVLKSSSDKTTVRYVFADPRAVVSMSLDDEVDVGDELATVDIAKETLDKIKKQAGMMQLPHVQFAVESGRLVCVVRDCDNPSSNTISYDLGEANDIDIGEDIIVKTDNLRIIPDDYALTVCEEAIIFTPLNNTCMKYIVARYVE